MTTGYVKFQFQFGAIKSMKLDRQIMAEPNFNSNLVRLKESRLSLWSPKTDISIPIWCD